MPDPRSAYTVRLGQWNEAIARGQRIHLFVSNLRLAAAAAFALAAWLAIARDLLSPVWMGLALIAFVALVAAHARVLHRNERAARARRLYERGLERLDGRWAGTGVDGGRFLPGHPYARDLDLFGPGSLFQLLNASRTEGGEQTLADWLRSPAAPGEVRARQQAVAELAPQMQFRETLAVVAAEAHVGRTSALNRWAALQPAGLSLAAGLLFLICGLVTALLIAAPFAGLVPSSVPLIWFFVAGAIVMRWRNETALVTHRIDAASDDLALFREIVEIIEQTTFSAPWLVDVHQRLMVGGEKPSRTIARLQRLVSILDQYQHNPYARLIGLPLLVGPQVAVAIDRWHASHGAALAAWIQIIGELEAMASLATYTYEHPDDPFPSLVEGRDGAFDGVGLAHPLLPEAKAIRNDLRLGGAEPHVYLVSGSNMSGKSTLLRAVGVNVVLALAGAPVRAAKLSVAPFNLGATLRVDDSLQEGYSRFYAEILRIKAIVDGARERPPFLFLLDEILHGTNSYDRRIGAEAIVRALVDAGAVGLVTTHDLALTELTAALGSQAVNVHFEDQVAGQQIVFDYRLRPGVVERSNALALMRAIGIDV